MTGERSLLLYADDPGAVNCLAPLASALRSAGWRLSFVVAASLARYVADRGIECLLRSDEQTPEALVAGVEGIVVGTSEDPHCFAHRLTVIARETGIWSLGVVDMDVNAARRFRGLTDSPLAYAPDYLAVPNSLTADAYVALGFPQRDIRIAGSSHYDTVRARRAELERTDRNALRATLFANAAPDRPIWLYLAEGEDGLDPRTSYRSPSYTLHGRGGDNFRTAIVLEEILDAARDLQPRPFVALRLHPKSRMEDFSAYVAEVDQVSASGDPLPLVWAADLVIGMTTMLLLEAYLLGRPHLSVLPRAEEKSWLITTGAGLTPVATTRSELHQNIAEMINHTRIVSHSNESAVLPFDATATLVSWIESLSLRSTSPHA